ncbi:MAG: DNA double-strand break repair nuclease NurA [Methanosphaera sp.]|nr:DNA double-strand break repair nuclease NurA [Methanosphaera sp.]
MLDILYQKSIEKKEEINEYFDNIIEEINLEKVEKEYKKYEFTKTKQDKNFAAIDGSFNKKKFMPAYLYTITSQTIISKKNMDAQKESAAGEISTVSTIYNQKIDKILSTYMSILELKSTIDTLKKHQDIDYMLLDGSISGTLLNYHEIELGKELNELIKGLSINNIPKELEEDNITLEIITERIKSFVLSECEKVINKNNLEYNLNDIEMDIILALAGFEELFAISYLLKNFKEKIICVSKTSTTKTLFNEKIPDAAVIEYACNVSGYTKPLKHDSMRPVRYVNNVKRQVDFPVEKIQLSNTPYKVFFTKLEDTSNVLKIEIPYDIPDEKILDILNDLESISVNGYPHILKRAHDEVKIKTKHLERIARNMGLYEKTGRDMLEN